MKSNRKFDKGFTLIELLVTIAIIGTLAAIAIPMYSSQQSQASRSAALSDGRAWADTVTTGLNGYTNFGATTNGSVALTTNASPLVVTFGTGYLPTGTASVSTPVGVTSGTTITSSWTWGTQWCFVASNNGQRVLFTQAGVATNASTATLACTAGTTTAGSITS